MNVVMQLLSNKILGVAILSWFIAQVIKIVITLLQERKLDFTKLWASGGMPSSHSSFVTALAISVGQVQGYDSALFAACAVMSFVVMYDAANVRLEAGKQAVVINQIIKVLENPNLNPEERLKELLGHTPFQVFAGFVLGSVVSLICYM